MIVEPGATATFDEGVTHSVRQNIAPRFLSADPSGVYRLRLGSAFWKYDPVSDSREHALEVEYLYSGAFRIVRR